MKKLAIIIAAIAVLAGCSKEGRLKLNSEDIYLYSSDKHIITSNGTNVSFSSQNPYIASVNPTTGQVEGLHIGKTYIDVSSDQGKASVKVTVKPMYNVITDPYLDWGATRNDIINKVGKPYTESDTQLIYQYGDANKGDSHIGTSYILEYGELNSVMIVINDDSYGAALRHLSERYQAIGYSGTTGVFGDALDPDDVTTTVTIGEMYGQCFILYTQRD